MDNYQPPREEIVWESESVSPENDGKEYYFLARMGNLTLASNDTITYRFFPILFFSFKNRIELGNFTNKEDAPRRLAKLMYMFEYKKRQFAHIRFFMG
jgi:hypothetical protein